MKPSLLSQLEKIVQRAEHYDERYLLSKLKQIIIETDLNHYTREATPSLETLLNQYTTKILQPSDEKNDFFPSGLQCIDNNPSIRFRNSEYIVIAGRPSMGKTQFMAQLAYNIAQSAPVLYNTFDLSAEGLLLRILKSATQLPIDIIQEGSTNEHLLKELNNAVDSVKKLPLYLNDIFTHQLFQFLDNCHKQIEENGVKVIFIDYLQLLGGSNFRNREQEISLISRELKTLARNYKVCVIAASQLSRAVETRAGDKRPVLSDMRDSGSIEQDADKVFAIYRPEYYGFSEDSNANSTRNLVELMLIKNRNGAIADLKINVNDNFSHFSDFVASASNYEKIEIPFITKRLKELDDDNNPF